MRHTGLAEYQCGRGNASVGKLSQEGQDLGVCIGGERALSFFPVARFEVQREGVHRLRPQEVGHLLDSALGKESEPGLQVGDTGG